MTTKMDDRKQATAPKAQADSGSLSLDTTVGMRRVNEADSHSSEHFRGHIREGKIFQSVAPDGSRWLIGTSRVGTEDQSPQASVPTLKFINTAYRSGVGGMAAVSTDPISVGADHDLPGPEQSGRIEEGVTFPRLTHRTDYARGMERTSGADDSIFAGSVIHRRAAA